MTTRIGHRAMVQVSICEEIAPSVRSSNIVCRISCVDKKRDRESHERRERMEVTLRFPEQPRDLKPHPAEKAEGERELEGGDKARHAASYCAVRSVFRFPDGRSFCSRTKHDLAGRDGHHGPGLVPSLYSTPEAL